MMLEPPCSFVNLSVTLFWPPRWSAWFDPGGAGVELGFLAIVVTAFFASPADDAEIESIRGTDVKEPASLLTVPVPRETLDRWAEAMERMRTTHSCDLGVNCADCDDLRAALAEVRRVRGEG